MTRKQLEHAIRADRDFVRVLLTEGMIHVKTLTERIQLLRIDEQMRERLLKWVQNTSEEL